MIAVALLLAAAIQADLPPAIPHPLEPGAACTECHGAEIQGGVPAIPHKVRGYCQSCHVAGGKSRSSPEGKKAHRKTRVGLPPAIPHAVFMRENCQACHGKDRHPGMRKNPHPERVNCMACHST
jgi:cytochrome c-type protein NapB